MFKKARIKLTLFYLAIIMTISLSFSFIAYRFSTFELRRGLRMQNLRNVPLNTQQVPPLPIPSYIEAHPLLGIFFQFPKGDEIESETKIFNEGSNRILVNLGFINLAILLTAGLGGYFLAGRTLDPIEKMVEEQKRFTADASHEFRTPLTSIKTEVEVALRDKNLNLKDAKDLLTSNLEEVDKMQKLSNYLLALTKYEEGVKSIVLTKTDLKDIAENIIEKLSPNTHEKKIRIQANLKSATVRGNETALSELTSLLVENAIKYSHPNSKIIIRTRKDDNHGILEVQDFGIGINSSELPFIFNRFYRADSSHSKVKTDGYGLGLSIAKNIVDLHHGKIEVKSSIGKGSTFKVMI